MGNLLNKIKSIKNEIKELTELGNEKALEYCELAIKIADTEEDILNTSSSKEDLDDQILNFKIKKGILHTIPIGIILSVLFFLSVVITCIDKLSLGTILFAVLGTPSFSIAFAFMFSSFLMHSKIFNNFLLKKYEGFKSLNEKKNNLITKIKLLEKELENIKTKKNEIENFVMNNEEIIENKREELNYLEEMYFNDLFNNPVNYSTVYDVNSTYKKRSRTRGNGL